MAIETRVVHDIEPDPASPRAVKRAFVEGLENGGHLRVAGTAKDRPEELLERGFTPTHRIDLFGATYWVARLRRDHYFRFFVAWVQVPSRPRDLQACIFYKDTSLVWRSGSHTIRTEDDDWVGKGAVKRVVRDGHVEHATAEETTNLPLEIQHALDEVSRAFRTVPVDYDAVGMVLRNAPPGRIEPYRAFTEPRRRAMARKRDRINGGEPVAWFDREGDPASLRFARGFEPDFRGGVVELRRTRSRMYDGEVRKYRILSRNAEIQYQFIATPRLIWIIPPQALTTELMGFGLRTTDVEVAEDLCLPGYEFHFLDDSTDPPELYSQIPEGYAGTQSEVDPVRAETSPWLERMPVIRAFRKAIDLPWPAPRIERVAPQRRR